MVWLFLKYGVHDVALGTGQDPRGLAERFLDQVRFLQGWLRAPLRVGAIAPSGRALARRMAAEASSTAGVVVELGGGTGSITRGLIAGGIDPARLIVLERDRDLHATLRHHFPDVDVVLGDAADLESLLAQRGIGQVGAVISGLPLLSFPSELQRAILQASFKMLAPGGRFIQFTYGPASPVKPSLLASLTLSARRLGHWVWLNVPPARIWCFERTAA